MKESKIGPLLLLLLCVLSPRNNSANPVPSQGDVMEGNPIIHGPTDGEAPKILGSTVIGTTEVQSSITRPIVFGTNGGQHAALVITIHSRMMKGAEIFRITVNWLQAQETIQNSLFQEATVNFQKKIANIPESLAFNRSEIIEVLIKSTELIRLRKENLDNAAKTLKEYCVEMLEIYNRESISLLVLNATGKRFVKFATTVSNLLNMALDKTNKLNDQLTAAEAYLIDYTAKLRERLDDIKPQKTTEEILEEKRFLEKQIQIQEVNEDITVDGEHYDRVKLGVCILIFTESFIEFRFGCISTDSIYSNKIAEAKNKTEDLQLQIDYLDRELCEIHYENEVQQNILPALASGNTTITYVQVVKEYLLKEIILIGRWQLSLNLTLIDYDDEITNLDIQLYTTGMKRRLDNLKDACDDYINHKIPDIIKVTPLNHLSSE